MPMVTPMVTEKYEPSKGALHLLELAGQTIAGPVILTMNSAFSCTLFRIWLIRLDSFD